MNKFLKKILMIFLLSTSGLSFATFIETKDYIVLDNPVTDITTNTDKDKIEVIEFFNYGCPYCYMLEPEMTAWLADKPDNIIVKKIAIPRKGKWVEYARLFYALEMISPQEQQRVTPLIYTAIHEQKRDFGNKANLFTWAQSQNVDSKLLEQYYNSDEVTQKLLQAVELAKMYNLQYVPSIFVNNQYQLILDSSNHYQGTKTKLNELINLVGH